MWRNIVLWFLSILLWFAPNSKSLRFDYDKTYYNPQGISDTVLPVIKSQNAAALEAMLCKNIKDNFPGYHTTINEMLALTSGVTSYSLKVNSAEYDGSRGGKSISQKTCDLRYTKDGVEYSLGICWEVNNFSPSEAGIRQIAISEKDIVEGGWVDLVFLYATEGVRNWHD